MDERAAAAKLVPGDRRIFVMSYLRGVDPTWRVLCDEKAYGIESAVDPDLKHRELEIRVRLSSPEYPVARYSDISIAEIATATYRFSWDSDGLATSKARYRIVGAGDWFETAEDLTRALAHTLTARNLTPGRHYEVQVSGKNADGATSGWSQSATWQVPAVGSVITNVGFSVSRTSIVTSFGTGVAAGCTVWGSPDDDESEFSHWVSLPTTHGPAHSHEHSGLKEGTVYRIAIYAYVDGLVAMAPTESGYYRVRTESDDDEGGVLQIVTG
jgi:hypothetical protein